MDKESRDVSSLFYPILARSPPWNSENSPLKSIGKDPGDPIETFEVIVSIAYVILLATIFMAGSTETEWRLGGQPALAPCSTVAYVACM